VLGFANIVEYDRHYLDIEIQAEVEDGDPTRVEPHKNGEWEWYDLEALPSPLFRPCHSALHALKTGNWFSDTVVDDVAPDDSP
jgi:8-oxo-dGTP diphosphatase